MKITTGKMIGGAWEFGFRIGQYVMTHNRTTIRIGFTFAKWFISFDLEPRLRA